MTSVTIFVYKVPCITGDTFGSVIPADHGGLILTRGETGDLT